MAPAGDFFGTDEGVVMATAKAKGLIFEDWLRDRCARQVDVSTLHAALYRDYCQHAGEAALGAQAFARALEAAGIKALKLPGGQHRKGVRLRAIETIDQPGAATREQVGAIALAARGVSRTSTDGVDEITVKLDVKGMLRAPDAAPLWQLTPIAPGVAPEVGLMLEIAGDGDEASARVAHELFMERQRQKSVEGFAPDHDDDWLNGQLQRAAAAYAYGAAVKPGDANWLRTDVKLTRPPAMYHTLETLRALWPWSFEWWKPTNPRRMLVKAGALIIAAIEAIDRKQLQDKGRA